MTLTKPPRGVLGHSALEVGAWLVALCTATLSYTLAGTAGYGSSIDPAVLRTVTETQRAGDFNVQMGTPALLVMTMLALLGLLVPTATVHKLQARQRTQLLMGAAVLTAILAAVLTFVLSVWLTWAVALCLGILVAMVAAHTPQLHQKPWRTAGVATGMYMFLTYLFQLNGGVAAGTDAVRWLLLLGAIVLAASAALVVVSPLESDEVPNTAGFPLTRSLRFVRGHLDVSFAWACYALFVLFGVVFIMALPAVADNGYGQAGFAVIVAAVLFGWAAGYEAGPTFAPGMTRPRLTAFALVAASVFTIGAGLITELSGKAVLSALVAFCVGVGVRSQNYTFSRRVGSTAGVFLALLLSCMDLGFTTQLSPVSQWVLSGSTVTYLLLGTAGLIVGIIAVFTFSPLGAQGLAVDLIHAFRNPHDSHEPVPPREAPDSTEAPSNAAGQPQSNTAPGPVTTDQPSAALEQEKGMSVNTLRAPSTFFSDTGVFIALEGGDGAGKTTQAKLLAEYLHKRGFSTVEKTREPGGTVVGNKIREVLLGDEGLGERSEALLFAADRAHHVASLIMPTLKAGGAVVSDRYVDSSLAYQAAGRELSQAEVLTLSRWATVGLLPHITVVLDIDPDAAAPRLGERGGKNHFDEQDAAFKRRVRDTFLTLAAANPERYVVVDATGGPQEVFEQIKQALDAHLPAQRPMPDSGAKDSFMPQAPRGRYDGVPTERLSDDDSAEQHGAVPQFLAPEQSTSKTHVAPADPREAETTVLPASRGVASSPEEAETSVLPARTVQPHGPVGAQPNAAHADLGPEEAETTVLPASRGGASGPEEAETTVLPASHGVAREGEHRGYAGEDAETTVLPAHEENTAERATHRPNLDRLRAQARIERQARERLRKSREQEQD